MPVPTSCRRDPPRTSRSPELPLPQPAEAVLVVDDDPSFLALLEVRLRGRRGGVRVARSVSEAVEVLETTDVDVVISDHAMPEATGLHLLAYVRRRGLPLRFVLVSAALPPEAEADAHAAGAYVLDKLELLQRL